MLELITDQTYPSKVNGTGDFVLAFSGTTWCGPCKALHPHLDQLARHYANRVHVFEIDDVKAKRFINRFGITQFPTIFVIRLIDGKQVYAHHVKAGDTMGRVSEIRQVLATLGHQ